MLLAADKAGLTGLWFEGQKYFARSLEQEHLEQEIPVLTQAKEWLDLYFSGKRPDFEVPLHLTGTDFQNEVWEILRSVPYGQTTTYGEIAKTLAARRGLAHMSAQAVGGAVGVDALTVPSASGVCVAKRFPVAVGEASKAFSRCSFSHCTS